MLGTKINKDDYELYTKAFEWISAQTEDIGIVDKGDYFEVAVNEYDVQTEQAESYYKLQRALKAPVTHDGVNYIVDLNQAQTVAMISDDDDDEDSTVPVFTSDLGMKEVTQSTYQDLVNKAIEQQKQAYATYKEEIKNVQKDNN